MDNTSLYKYGYYSSLFLSIITIVTFTIAIFTPPISGIFCLGDCIEYPYLDIASRYPRDYFWMFPALIMMILFMAFMTSIHQYTAKEKKVYSLTGLGFAFLSASIIIVNYFMQISIVPISILYGEFDGISLLTQYNEHGIFIALEEIGYILMSLAFLMLAFVFNKKIKYGSFLRWIFITSFVLSIISLVSIAAIFGLNRGYLFEVVIILITWIELIVAGFLVSGMFRSELTRINV
jgi:hypothetical protein